VSDLAVNPEMAEWLRDRQSQLHVTTTTVTAGGQALDWVPIESQTGGPVATPPPTNLSPAAAADQARPTQVASFDTVEPGPAGHVPIVRPDLSKVGRAVGLDDFLAKRGGYLVNVNRSNKKPTDPNPFGYFHATSSQTTNIYGCDAWLNVWDPAIDVPAAPGGDDHSISQTWLQNYQKVELQSLEAGLTVDRGLNGDSYNHLFTYFATNGYPVPGSIDAPNGLPAVGNNVGGYNRLQSGWVQYSPTIFPGIRVNGSSAQGGTQLEIAIKYQLYEGNWWFGVNNNESGPWIWIGYYPASLFWGPDGVRTTGIANLAQWVSFGGEVYSALANPCATQDQMGSGRHAADGWTHAAYQRALRNQANASAAMVNYDGFPEVDAAASNCPVNEYTIQCYMDSGSSWGSYQYYGGPSNLL
jgi:hypothetical protein